MAETWAQYVRRATQGTTQVQLALVTGVAQTAIGRWLRGETAAPRAESVVAFARAIGKPPVEALVAAGYLTPSEAAQRIEVNQALSEYSTNDLLDELRRRTVDGR
ncbi:helix-turn-helix domain-containing protein [Mycobacterium sp. NBC_00419]|uniref:helix-turn-helix domain-containing protein n=1 Tax=Mycobacterium sp. NBC_00419 TaxID=2975989 RepID=UPI002E1C9B5C